MKKWLSIVVATALWGFASVAAAQTAGNCHWDNSFNPPKYVCGDDAGGGDDDLPPTYWTSWFATGFCLSPSDGEALLWERSEIDRETGLALQTEYTCVKPDWGIVWDDISQVAAALGVPQFEMAPPSHFGAVVGSPMLLWYTGQTQIPPIAATVTDPTGVVYGVEGRAWIEQITWNMGDGSSVNSSYRDSFDNSTSFGSFEDPEALYTYELTSHSQGYDADPDRCDLAFTPVSVTLTWTGEYRAVEGILQTSWNRVPANLDITETFEIPVREIRSSLNSEGDDPGEDQCVWIDPEG